MAQGIPLENPKKLALSGRKKKNDAGVPWRRAGRPGKDVDPKNKREVWRSLVANTGADPSRLLADDDIIDHSARISSEPVRKLIEERAFAMFWDRYNNLYPDDEKPLLYALLDEKLEKMINDERVREVAERVAQSVVQWFGTKVGTEFDQMVRKFVDQEMIRLKPEVEKRRKLMQAAGEISMPTDDEIKAEMASKKDGALSDQASSDEAAEDEDEDDDQK